MLTSGSLQLSSMARTLCEETRLHHTIKRLSRMLGTHSEMTWAAEDLLLKQMASRITDDMMVAIDPGDLKARLKVNILDGLEMAIRGTLSMATH